MKRLWTIVGIAALVAFVGVASVGAVVFAQDDGKATEPFDFGTRFKEALAGILGITVEEYDNAVEQAQDQVVDQALEEGWLTEDQAEMLRWRMDQAPSLGMPGLGKGFFGGFGHGGPRGWGGNNLLSVAADQLGMSLTELLTELQNGKSIADVAAEKGLDTQAIVDAYVARVKEDLDEAVADGDITQNQANYQLEQIRERVTDQLDNTWSDNPRGFWGRHGGMMGIPSAGDL